MSEIIDLVEYQSKDGGLFFNIWQDEEFIYISIGMTTLAALAFQLGLQAFYFSPLGFGREFLGAEGGYLFL